MKEIKGKCMRNAETKLKVSVRDERTENFRETEISTDIARKNNVE